MISIVTPPPHTHTYPLSFAIPSRGWFPVRRSFAVLVFKVNLTQTMEKKNECAREKVKKKEKKFADAGGYNNVLK